MLNEQKKIGLPPVPRRPGAVVDLHSRRHLPLRVVGGPPWHPGSRPPMKRSLLFSVFLHMAVMAVMIFGLPRFLPPLPPPLVIVPVEITTIGEITNTRLKSDKEPEKPAPPVKQAQKQPPAPAKPPPEEKPPEQKAPPEDKREAEALPDKARPKPPKKKSEPKKAVDKPKPKPKPKQDLLASVLKNVAQLKPHVTAKTTDENAPEDEAEQSDQAPALSDRLTITEEDALRRQIGQCWNMPVGARYAEELIVAVRIAVNPDRTVRSAEVIDRARMASDPFFRAAAESAVRALRHPNCTPLALPEEGYEQWKVITFNFDPRDML